MKKVKGLICVLAAVSAIASCDKTPVSDAQVGFVSQTNYFCFEDGIGDDLGDCLNFEIPVTVTGENITYPVTIKIDNLEGTGAMLDGVKYTERNSCWRFTERELVIESPEDKPVVTVRQIAPADTIYVGIKLEALSNCTITSDLTEVLIIPEVCYKTGDYTAKTTSLLYGESYTDTWNLDLITETYEGEVIYHGPAIYGYMGFTEDVGGYPMYCQTGRLNLGGDLGSVFGVALPFDGSVYVAAAMLELDPETAPGVETLCVICPVLYQDKYGPYFGEVYLAEVAEGELAVLYNPADPTVDGKAYLSAGVFDYNTGAFVDIYDVIAVDGNLVKSNAAKSGELNFTSSITGKSKSYKCTPYTGPKLPKKSFQL